MIAISIVSHGHGEMVSGLVNCLLTMPDVKQIIVTKNIHEHILLPSDTRIILIENINAKGFGANHNAAFKHCDQQFYCPLNPDIKLIDNPFNHLISEIERSGAGLIAPLVLSPNGTVEDSIRTFPTPWSIMRKVFFGAKGSYDSFPDNASFHPEWVAGMFMLFHSAAFEYLGGFDEAYFMYYEDVDICKRAKKAGIKIAACPSVSVIHEAQRRSHRDTTHLHWHLSSMLRYFWRHWNMN